MRHSLSLIHTCTLIRLFIATDISGIEWGTFGPVTKGQSSPIQKDMIALAYKRGDPSKLPQSPSSRHGSTSGPALSPSHMTAQQSPSQLIGALQAADPAHQSPHIIGQTPPPLSPFHTQQGGKCDALQSCINIIFFLL